MFTKDEELIRRIHLNPSELFAYSLQRRLLDFPHLPITIESSKLYNQRHLISPIFEAHYITVAITLPIRFQFYHKIYTRCTIKKLKKFILMAINSLFLSIKNHNLSDQIAGDVGGMEVCTNKFYKMLRW